MDFKKERIALTICEDIWNLTENPLYPTSAMDLFVQQHPTMLISVTVSPFALSFASKLLQYCRRSN